MSPSDSASSPAEQLTGGFVLTAVAERAVGIRLGVLVSDRARQVDDANWWLDFFGFTLGGEALGLVCWDGENHAVAVADGCEASIVSTSTATLVPMLVFRFGLDAGADVWYEIRAQWQDVKSELIELHSLLGGQDNLTALQEVIFDDDARVACSEEDPSKTLATEAARCSVLQRLDPSLEHVAYREYVQKLIEVGFVWPPPPNLGPWGGSAINAAFATARQHRLNVETPGVLDCALEMLAWPASLGLCHPEEAVHIDMPSGGEAVPLLREAASFIMLSRTQPPSTMNIGIPSAISEAMAEKDTNRTAEEYLHSAERQLEARHWRNAWYALLSAAFWDFQARERGEPEHLTIACRIGEHAGWRVNLDALKSIVAAKQALDTNE